jgi:tRNA-specific 2-thiouridylase
MNSPLKVIVGMSGGVDSSVAAFLLLQQGYEVEGLFMKNWDEDDGSEYCTAIDDLADAQQVSDKLGIRLHTANFAADYWDNVFEHFLAEYRAGRTPNPDILCNREIKFKVFLDYAQLLGADLIATGHYTRVTQSGGHTRLLKGVDNNKDQSYFLHAVSGKAFAKSLFPVGELTKPEVRHIAEINGFVTSDKKDSTGICFIGERRFKDFLAQYLPAQPGSMETPDGTIMGEHQGLMFYTLGQRQGLGIGGVKSTNDEPWFTLAKDLDRNVLIVGQGAQHPQLFTNSLSASDVHWINLPLAVGETLLCSAKTRYRQSDQKCCVSRDDNLGYIVNFEVPQRAITPGQSVVFYHDEHCLGGGVIEKTWNQTE